MGAEVTTELGLSDDRCFFFKRDQHYHNIMHDYINVSCDGQKNNNLQSCKTKHTNKHDT